MKLKVSIIFIAVFLLTSCTGPISERDYKEPWDRYLLYSLDDMNKLIKIAEKRFGRLTRADKILFLAVATGTLADYTKGSDTNEPNNTDSRSNMQIIKATRIEWLCKSRLSTRSNKDIVYLSPIIASTSNKKICIELQQEKLEKNSGNRAGEKVNWV